MQAGEGSARTSSCVIFYLNGERHEVPLERARKMTVAQYLRQCTKFSGTKIGCGQGGCGACTVAISTRSDANDEKQTYISAASCLYPVCELHGLDVRTVEGIVQQGNKPHPIQERLSEYNGTQCGFCTPGMVMTMFAALNNCLFSGQTAPGDNDQRFSQGVF